jgi:multidrug efflux pump subunit AcrB
MKNTFSIITTFVLLSIIGGAFIPLLNIQLKPSRSLPTLNVSYSWYNASARLVEQKVTSKLEGLFSAMKGVKNINSTSSQGYGNIELEFKKEVDMDAARFELATLIRLAHPELPEEVSYPFISNTSNENQTPPILSYRLNAAANPNYIQKLANKSLVSRLSQIKGVKNIIVYGAMPNEWIITYDNEKCRLHTINVSEISEAIRNYLDTKSLGIGKMNIGNQASYIQIKLKNQPSHELDWDKIPIKKANNRIIYLGDLAKARYKEKLPQSYFRINGLNTINLVIYPEKEVNTIRLSKAIKNEMQQLKENLPKGFSVLLAYDASEDLNKELEKLSLRAIFSLVVLLLFVLIMSRQIKYLFLILISLISNLLIACIFYVILEIEIQLYSLAGITISFGIIIDNSIIMIHHFLGKGNRKVFLSILAASLTTIGSLVIIFFLSESQKINLIDFAWVIIINLAVSLFIALFFIPALLHKVALKKKKVKEKGWRRKVENKLITVYGKTISFNKRIKWVYFVLILLIFGIPFHLLPEKNEKEGFWPELYNGTFGSDWYQQDAKQFLEKWMGGTFRLFSEYVYEQSFYADPQRTTLHVRGAMPEGCTIHQLNDVMTKMENYISLFTEVEMYQTSIRSHKDGQVSIFFKDEFENGSFPYYLKGLLTSKAISLGGLDWTVYGVGKGFNNAIHTGSKNSHIFVKGYNYDELHQYAEQLSKKLKENPRVDNIDIESQVTWFSEAIHEYNLNFKFENFALYGQHLIDFNNYLTNTLFENKVTSVYTNNELVDVILKSNQANKFDLWSLKNIPFQSETNSVKVPVLANLSKEKTGNSIIKVNQQYQLVVAYDFIGPQLLSEKVMKKHIEEMNQILPLGYKCSEPSWGWWDKKEKTQYYLLFIIILIIYFICSILLESLTQPLVIIAMIPISFIGIFLTFYLFDFNFDQGGFASFVLLSGITVNSGIYLINEYNQLKQVQTNISNFELYLTAFKNKIAPIFLTIISTILGLVPFIYAGQNEVFWFAFAVGSIGGLIFSFVAIIIYLPLMMKLSTK